MSHSVNVFQENSYITASVACEKCSISEVTHNLIEWGVYAARRTARARKKNRTIAAKITAHVPLQNRTLAAAEPHLQKLRSSHDLPAV